PFSRTLALTEDSLPFLALGWGEPLPQAQPLFEGLSVAAKAASGVPALKCFLGEVHRDVSGPSAIRATPLAPTVTGWVRAYLKQEASEVQPGLDAGARH